MLRPTVTPAPDPTALDWFNAAAGALGALGSVGVAAVGAAVAWQVHKYRQERDTRADKQAALESRRDFAKRFNDDVLPIAVDMAKADGLDGRDAIRGRLIPIIDATAGHDDRRLELVRWWSQFAEAYGTAETQEDRVLLHSRAGLLTSSWVEYAVVPDDLEAPYFDIGNRRD